MCGVLGFASFKTPVPFSELGPAVEALGIRGRDGWGVAMMGPEDVSFTFQRDLQPVQESLEVVAPERLRILLANTRAVPTSEFEQGAGFDLANQQPFSDGKWTVVHNGLIANDKALVAKYGLTPSCSVDSAILPHLFTKIGIEAGMRELEGSFSIVAYLNDGGQGTVYFGSNFTPMVYYHDQVAHALLVSSTKEMLEEYTKSPIEAKPYTLYQYIPSFDSLSEVASLYRKPKNKKVLVICSGGIDSVTTAYAYKAHGYEVSLLHFTYGQAAQTVEQYSVEMIAKDLQAELIVYDATRMFEPFKAVSKLLHQTEADPNERMMDQEHTVSYVPNRNMLFASVAAGIAEMHGIDTIALGAQQMDGGAYPDNNPTFIDAVSRALKYSLNQQTRVDFEAPLVHLMKHEVLEVGLWLGVPFQKVTSCYYPKRHEDGTISNCGKCGCCAFRMNSFRMMGYQDPQLTDALDLSYWQGCKQLDEYVASPKFRWVKAEIERIFEGFQR